MAARYELTYDRSFDEDLAALDAYVYPAIRATLIQLADQAEVVARHRRPLARPISWCPEATWQLRVGDFRVLYRIDGGVVRVLRVAFKGSGTTEEMGP
jgi:mRNA-degrading endonuclease RelE of RelBE toxin-antitoxin system